MLYHKNIDAAYGTTKRDTGSSGGDSGMASAMAELAAAQLALRRSKLKMLRKPE